MKNKFLLLSVCFLVERGLKLVVMYYGRYDFNTSAALGIIQLSNQQMIIIMVLLSFLLIIYSHYSKIMSLNFILLGSVSNLIDRLIYNGVVDFVPFFGLFSFNLADIYIFVGIILLITYKFNATEEFPS